MNACVLTLILACFVRDGIVAKPQQQPSTDFDLQKAIEDVFSSSTLPPRRGPGDVLTPEPFVNPTSAPVTLITNGEQCTCVPYHQCDPKTNSSRNQEEIDLSDGFGQIDIRFDPDDCQDVLDVCCKGVNRPETPIIVPPVQTKPNRASGCGIRNVDGLDFKLQGAFVSIYFPYKFLMGSISDIKMNSTLLKLECIKV